MRGELGEASKQVLYEKNTKKEKHLQEKFLPKKESNPGNLERYKSAKIFSENEANLKSKFRPENPLIYGNIELDEDEKAAIVLFYSF